MRTQGEENNFLKTHYEKVENRSERGRAMDKMGGGEKGKGVGKN